MIQAGRPVASGPPEEESPDRKGHPAAEIADGRNLLISVTENYRHGCLAAEGKGENVGQEPTVCDGDAAGVRIRGLQDQIYWQMRAARPMPGGRLRR